MDKDSMEIISIQNISNYDFPEIDTKAMNHEYRTTRSNSETDEGRVYRRPQVPTLMWNNETYALKAGEVKQYPKWLAMHFAEKIIDRAMIEDGKIVTLTDERQRQDYARRVVMEEAPKTVKEEPVKAPEPAKEEEPAGVAEVALDEMGMPQLRVLAKKLGVEFMNTTKKVELIKLINEKQG